MINNKDMMGMIFPIWFRIVLAIILIVVVILMILGVKEVVDIVQGIFIGPK